MTDTHCHLNDPTFESAGVDEIIRKCKTLGVSKMICCGTNVRSSEVAVNIANTYEGVFATAGLHPECLAEFDLENVESLRSGLLVLTDDKKVIAIGEAGLDFRDTTNPNERRAQAELFEFNVDLALRSDLPLVVHCRNAFSEVYELVKDKKLVGQMHCFTGNREWMEKFLSLGWYISFGGIITFKSSNELRELVRGVPNDRMLFETDSPYLSPEPMRGRKNEPASVKIIAELAARIRGVSYEEIEVQSDENCRRLFGI